MSSASGRSQVFISYSHEDRDWLKLLQKQLRLLIRDELLNAWDDTQIKPGQEWRPAIEQALAQAKVAVLLVSPDFLASDFIATKEVPPLLEAAQSQGATILWVLLSHCLWDYSPLKEYQAASSTSTPLDALSPSDRNKALADLARTIKKAIDANP